MGKAVLRPPPWDPSHGVRVGVWEALRPHTNTNAVISIRWEPGIAVLLQPLLAAN